MWYGNRVNKSYIIPNAINEQFIRPVYSGSKDHIIIGAGRLTKQKNFELLLEAFSRISSEFPNYNLYIYGDGPNKGKLLELSNKLGVSEKVHLPGRTDKLSDEMEKASIFVLSSDYEGMPNVLIEAMALGLPCVSTNCDGGGAQFLIENGVNGLLVPKNDVDALSCAVLNLLRNESLKTDIGNNARKIIDRLSPSKVYSLWENVIKEVTLSK